MSNYYRQIFQFHSLEYRAMQEAMNKNCSSNRMSVDDTSWTMKTINSSLNS